MPATINIWDTSQMSTCAQTGGTWTYTGTLAPAPTPPATYNGVADFTGITLAGDYEFTYTVGTATSIHTVTYGSTQPRINNVCANAKLIATPVPEFDITYTGYNNARCPGYDFPSNSGETVPSQWIYGATYLDQWYYFDVPAMTCNINLIVTVDGTGYNPGIESPAVALYSTILGGDCSGKVLASAIEENGIQEATTSMIIPPAQGKRIYIRLASEVMGEFDINIQAFPLSENCTLINSEATAETWGYPGEFIFGYDGASVWGY